MQELTKRGIHNGRTYGPTLNIEKFLKNNMKRITNSMKICLSKSVKCILFKNSKNVFSIE